MPQTKEGRPPARRRGATCNGAPAENCGGVVAIPQGMDAVGKNSAIKQVMSGINSQEVMVPSFK